MPISHGASPVASALGIRSGATLRGPHQPNMASPGRLSKQDISTLLGIGHFYFALTGGCGNFSAVSRVEWAMGMTAPRIDVLLVLIIIFVVITPLAMA